MSGIFGKKPEVKPEVKPEAKAEAKAEKPKKAVTQPKAEVKPNSVFGAIPKNAHKPISKARGKVSVFGDSILSEINAQLEREGSVNFPIKTKDNANGLSKQTIKKTLSHKLYDYYVRVEKKSPKDVLDAFGLLMFGEIESDAGRSIILFIDNKENESLKLIASGVEKLSSRIESETKA